MRVGVEACILFINIHVSVSSLTTYHCCQPIFTYSTGYTSFSCQSMMTSNPQSYASAALTSSDSRELTGTEAYAARCAMVSMPSSFDHSTPAPKLKMEDAMDVDTPSMHVSRTLSSVQVKREPMEEREIQGDYHHSTLSTANSPTREHLTTATRVSSTMYLLQDRYNRPYTLHIRADLARSHQYTLARMTRSQGSILKICSIGGLESAPGTNQAQRFS